MGAKRWQIGDSGRGAKRLLKKCTNRWWRRKCKQDPEMAPCKRPTKGYD